MRTWKVLKWENEPKKNDKRLVPLDCACGYEAECPSSILKDGLIVAVIGMGLIFDPPGYKPPKNHLPNEIQCRKCGRIYTDEGE